MAGVFDRVSPRRIVSNHWSSLEDRSLVEPAPDQAARLVLLLAGAGGAAGGFLFARVLPDAVFLLTGFTLLVGGLLALFAQFTAWQDRLEESSPSYHDVARSNAKSLVREAMAHILMAVLLSVAGLLACVFLAALAPGTSQEEATIWFKIASCVTYGLSGYLLALFVVILNQSLEAHEFVHPRGGDRSVER